MLDNLEAYAPSLTASKSSLFLQPWPLDILDMLIGVFVIINQKFKEFTFQFNCFCDYMQITAIKILRIFISFF